MFNNVVGALRVTLGINTAAFEEGLTLAQKQLNAAGKRMQAVGAQLSGVGQTLSMAVTLPLVALGAASVRAANESAQAIGQVNAALASMGPVSGRTSEQLQDAATSLMRLSTFDDDEILRSVTANMLTFGNVAGEQFDRAQRAAVDIATALQSDLQPAAIMVGKALNDPIKGLTALSKAGIQFTADQKEMIKGMVASGDAAGAQDIILNELSKQFAARAKAMRDATPGMDLKNSWDDFQETLGAIIVKVLPPLTAALAGMLDAFNKLSPGTQQFVAGLAAVAAIAGPVLMVVGGIASGLGAIMPVLAPVVALIGEAGLAAALGAAATAAAPFIAAGAALVGGWLLFGDKIGPVMTEMSTKFNEVLGPKITGLIDDVSAALTTLWTGPLGEHIRVVIGVMGDLAAGYFKVFGTVALAMIGGFIDFIRTGFRIVTNVFTTISALLRGDFSGAWQSFIKTIDDVIKGALLIISNFAPDVARYLSAVYFIAKQWLQVKLGEVFKWVTDKVDAVGNAFFTLYDRVVGHSYIPDMVDEIGQHMRRLDAEMVRPATAATGAAAEAFRELQSAAAGIFSRLFPDQAEANRFAQELATLEEYHRKAGTSAEMHAAAVERLRREYAGLNPAGMDIAMPDIGGAAAPTLMSDDAISDFVSGLSRGIEQSSEWRNRLADSFSGAFHAALDGNLGSYLKGWWSDMLHRTFSRVFDQLGSQLSNLFSGAGGQGGGGLNGIFSALGSLFGGARAGGGPVMANRAYLVGEKRPEMFVPSSAGRIVPNATAMGGGLSIRLDPSPLFRAYVRDEAGNIVGASAPAVAEMGGQSAMLQAARRRDFAFG